MAYKKKRFILFLVVCMSVCGHEFWCPGRLEALGSQELELQMVMNCLVWVLGIELRSSIRASAAVSHKPLQWNFKKTC